MIQQILAIWSLVPLVFLNPACTSGSSLFTCCWSLAWRTLRITLLACEMRAIVQWFEHSLSLPFFGIGMKTDLFQSCGHCQVFQICCHTECRTMQRNRGNNRMEKTRDFFLVVMNGCESWTVKKAEHWRIDAFELWCWRRLLRVPWTARRSNQSILKEISPEYSLEGLMPKLKLQYFWPPDAKSWLIWKDPHAGKDWGQGEKGTTENEMLGWHHWLNKHEFG